MKPEAVLCRQYPKVAGMFVPIQIPSLSGTRQIPIPTPAAYASACVWMSGTSLQAVRCTSNKKAFKFGDVRYWNIFRGKQQSCSPTTRPLCEPLLIQKKMCECKAWWCAAAPEVPELDPNLIPPICSYLILLCSRTVLQLSKMCNLSSIRPRLLLPGVPRTSKHYTYKSFTRDTQIENGLRKN